MNAYYRHVGPGYIIAFAYDVHLVDILKDIVPSDSRRWKPDAREWYITADYWSTIFHIFKGYGVTWHDITQAMDAATEMKRTAGAPPQQSVEAELQKRIAAVEERERALKQREEVAHRNFIDLMRREGELAARTFAATLNPSGSVSPEYKLLHLQPDAPREVVEAAYRALVKLHHPDRGGSNDKMARINAAFDKVKSWR